MNGLIPEVRLFFALEPSVDALQAVLASATALREGALAGAPLRWSNPEGWHVTSAFLGHVDVGLVPALRDVLAGLAPRPRAPALRFEALRGFPHDDALRVLVRTVDGAGVEAIGALEAELRHALGALGIRSETPLPYAPHLTLARAREATVDLRTYEVPLPAVPWVPLAVTLFESRQEAGRRRYVPLASVAW